MNCLWNLTILTSLFLGPDGSPNPYANYASQPSGSTFFSPPYRIPKNSTPASMPSSARPSGQNYVSPNNVGKSGSTATSKSHSNPYARPLSAKDIVSDILAQNNQKMKKTLSSNNVSGGTGINGYNSNGVGFPVNSFMRPQSAVRKEVVRNTNKESPTKDLNGYNHGLTSQASAVVNETKRASSSNSAPLGNAEEFSQIESLKSRSTNSLTQKTITSQGDQVITTRQGSSGVTVIQKVTAPPNFGTQINTIISKVTEPKSGSPGKSVSSIPKPGHSNSPSNASNGSGNSSGSASPESMAKVRNLNYTPTKPYDEVKDPAPKPIEEPAKTSAEPRKGILKTSQPQATVSETRLKKSPSTSSLNGGPKHTQSQIILPQNRTTYYKKGSKSEVMLHEQRPPVVGAPSKATRGQPEKSVTPSVDDCADEDEEEETESGPG